MVATVVEMKPKKPKRGRPPRTNATDIHATLPTAMREALAKYCETREPPATLTGAVELAVRRLLEAEGLWPPKPKR